ncbi:MAG: CDP-alcohol phosphatidyltransferase family protein [Planctomycetota bacterium]|nr:MAG: CDP-alcohol phosphatidyltransferase family protein [Planctomycetota bacterium]
MYRISWPNRITITRILLVGPFVVALLNLQDPVWSEWARWFALVVFGLMSVSDGLDGYLARKLNQESMAGQILDPLADKILIFSSVMLLAHEGTHVTGALLPPTVAVIAVGKDLIVVLGFCIIYFTTSKLYIELQKVGKWCTTSQLAMIIAILLSPNLPVQLSLLPNIMWWLASALAIAAIVQYYRIGRSYLVRYEATVKQDVDNAEK